MILLPSAALAIPCCDAAAAGECCGPEGDCPTAPCGQSALSAGIAPSVVVTSPSLDAPSGIRVAAESFANRCHLIAHPLVLARHPHHTPLYVSLGTLRN